MSPSSSIRSHPGGTALDAEGEAAAAGTDDSTAACPYAPACAWGVAEGRET